MPETGQERSGQRILVVDDDPGIRDLAHEYLTDYGYQVRAVATAAEAEACLAAENIDLVVLDLRLPDQDGTAFARALRARSAVPIIMLTGRTGESDRVLGLELGADDYVTKPFSPRELLARIRAVLRRIAVPAAGLRRLQTPRAYRFSGWELNMGTRRLVSPAGKQVELTSGEFNLLVAFLQSPRQVLSRDQLLEASRLHDDVFDRSIDVQILRLRRKVETTPAEPVLLRTERGVGYFLDSPVDVVR